MTHLFILHKYLLRAWIPVFFTSLLLFTLFVETLDIFVNLIRYLNQNVPWGQILYIQYLYLPSSFSFALPVAVLFSVSFTMSSLYSHNELIAIYASGISLLRFVLPLLFLGIVLGVGNFFFKEMIVIDTFREKNEITKIALNQDLGKSNTDVSVLQDGGNIIYRASFYDDINKTLSSPIVIETDNNGRMIRRIDANTAAWNDGRWVFNNVKIFDYTQNNTVGLTIEDTLIDSVFNAQPEDFQSLTSNIDEMRYNDALLYVDNLKNNGLSYRKLLTDTYSRIPLAISPLIVMIIACFAANAYGKNTFFVSLLVSLMAAIIYYSVDLMGSVLASRLLVPPIVGAWLGTAITILLSIILYRKTSR